MNFTVTNHQIQNARPYQEDSMRFFENDDWLITIVCDGMGGHPHGDLASRDASDFALKQLIECASKQNDNQEDVFANFIRTYDWLSYVKKGFTTYVAIIIHKETGLARIEHLGDSSVKVFCENDTLNAPTYKTVPHISVWGGITLYVPDYNKPTINIVNLQETGDCKIVIHSDGLDQAFMSQYSHVKAFDNTLEQLFDLAIENQSTDNISAYMIDIAK